ncbi:MAG TPA: TetR family transcriptional regulator [Thermomicrobiales bacterium]|nr:TetR family transcriptional regulator [Thermomicrobiales bacterium]
MVKERRPRADAQRNRDRLLEVAMHAFATEGPDVSLEAIARTAGVGIGTLYRHFPTRDALVEAVYRNEISRVSALAGEFRASMAPETALRAWMTHFVAFMTTKHGMSDVFRAVIASGGNPYGETRILALDAVQSLIAAGARAGTIRDDVSPLDILTILNGLSFATDDPEQTARLIDLVIDGLRRRD